MAANFAVIRDRQLHSSHRLQVTWFDGWNPSLDEALQELPELDCCPHDLYRTLLQTPGPVSKRAALVSDQGNPVAVVGLRQKGRLSWEPLTQWIIPGGIFPAQPGYHIPSLEVLGVEIQLAWWRMGTPPPTGKLVRSILRTPTFRMPLTQDFESYWRSNKHIKNIRKIRNRCQNFSFTVNAPGAAEWTIKKWENRWRINPNHIDNSLGDRLIAAKYLEDRGRYFTLWLLDRDLPIGGATLLVHNNDLVAGVIYREPEYDWYGVGSRLIDLSFSFGSEMGYTIFDIGGGQDYKTHWAPVEGEYWLLTICPESLFQAKKAFTWARQIRGNITNLVRGGHQINQPNNNE